MSVQVRKSFPDEQGPKVVPKSGNPLGYRIGTDPELSSSEPVREFPDQLIRILLSSAASAALEASGENAFAIVARAKRGTDEPETAGRWEITLAPVTWQTAQDASRVLLGEMKATAPKKIKATTNARLREDNHAK